MKGVTKVDLDFKKGLFTLTVKEGTTITPKEVRAAVRKQFQIPRVEVADLRGKVAKKGDHLVFTPKGQKVSYTLEAAKGKNTLEGLDDGKSAVVSGESVIVEKEKKKPVLTLRVETAKTEKS